MTNEQILEMAKREWSAGDTYIGPDIRSLTRFARLIEASVREECATHFDGSDTMIYRSEVAAAIRGMK